MPTERGWVALGAGASLIVLWILFGEQELGIAGVLLLLSVSVALTFVTVNRPEVTITRQLTPTVVHDGDHATVVMQIAATGRGSSNLNVADSVVGLGRAEFATARLDRTAPLTATYRVLCRARGSYPIGPAMASVTDTLRLARSTRPVGSTDSLLVLPAVEPLSGYPASPGLMMTVSAHRPEHSQRGGEDFYTLREYQQGDDLRRVHWPSSARRDQLMIRQLETPWQARALVILDPRSDAYEDVDAFEHAVRGAASAVEHLTRGGFDADVCVGPAIIDASHFMEAMEALALIQPMDGFDIAALGGRLRSLSDGGGALLVVTGQTDHRLLGLARLLEPLFPTTVLMSATTSTPAALAGFQRTGAATVVSRPGESWSTAWSSAIERSWHSVS